MTYADRLQKSINDRNSYIVAGFDPRPDSIPRIFHTAAASKAATDKERLYFLLVEYYVFAASTLCPSIAAVKPNLAFFEQYGLLGLKAYSDICSELRKLGLPVIADAKRGDIGSTALAYARAFLGNSKETEFSADALTVNPYLGFDTLEPFIEVCKDEGKGVYVLVKTSNPGSGELQGKIGDGNSLSERVAGWLGEKSVELMGECGFSGLGAVVGATYPQEAIRLRELMKSNLFLIPGMGAQGGSAKDAVAGFGNVGGKKGGALINLSRGLLSSFSSLDISIEQARLELEQKVAKFNAEIQAVL